MRNSGETYHLIQGKVTNYFFQLQQQHNVPIYQDLQNEELGKIFKHSLNFGYRLFCPGICLRCHLVADRLLCNLV